MSKPISERDLEIQYQSDTGNTIPSDFIQRATSSYPFFEWVIEQLLILKNKENVEVKHTKFEIKAPSKYDLGES